MKDESSRAKSAFTLIELLVVIAIIAVLAALLLPAMAAAKRRSRVTQCQNNFHQVYVASFVYANDYHDYFPVYGFVGAVNIFYAVSDTSYVVHNVMNNGGLPPHTVVNPGIQPDVFQNLGLLYATRLIGDGKALYCPGFPDTSIFGAARFSSPSFMSTDDNGWVRSSILYNPQVAPSGSRLFPKSSSLIAGRLFGMDILQALLKYNSITNAESPPTAAFTPDTFAHYPSQRFNVLFTDGSVKFVRSDPAIKYLHLMYDQYGEYDQLFPMLENAQ